MKNAQDNIIVANDRGHKEAFISVFANYSIFDDLEINSICDDEFIDKLRELLHPFKVDKFELKDLVIIRASWYHDN